MAEIMGVSLFLVVAVIIFFGVFSKNGRDLGLGGEIIHSFGGIKGKRKILTHDLQVHVIQAAPNLHFVGIEISAASVLSFQRVPITLPVSEARELARLLIAAADY